MTAHPMDLFPIRPLRFDAERLANADPVWSQSCPDFSRFINALVLEWSQQDISFAPMSNRRPLVSAVPGTTLGLLRLGAF